MKKTTSPTEAAKATFTSFPSDTNWVKGKFGMYSFEAKLFDSGSEFGINEGRVSKLEIKFGVGRTVVNYDRGWDIEVTKGHRAAYDAIMTLLENSPKRFNN